MRNNVQFSIFSSQSNLNFQIKNYVISYLLKISNFKLKNMYTLRPLWVFGICFLLYGWIIPLVSAVDCTVTPGGNITISSSCSFPYTVDGVDTGTGSTNTAVLQVNSGTMTVLGTQTIALGSLTLNGGSVAIVD